MRKRDRRSEFIRVLLTLFFISFSFAVANAHEVKANIYLIYEDEVCPGPGFFSKREVCKEFPPNTSDDFLQTIESTFPSAKGINFIGELRFGEGFELETIRQQIYSHHTKVTKLEILRKPLDRMVAAFFVISQMHDVKTIDVLKRYGKKSKGLGIKTFEGKNAKSQFIVYMNSRTLHPEMLQKLELVFTDGHKHTVTVK